MRLGEKISALRKRRKESLQAVAGAVEVSRAHVWEIETGRTKNPSIELVRRLADHFNVSVGWLVGEVPDEGNDPHGVALYRKMQTLSPQNRQHLQAIIDSMRKSQE